MSDIPKISKLTTAEKIRLVEELWESMASDESAVPVPESHVEELDRRLKKYECAPGKPLISWGTSRRDRKEEMT